jgi:hypothetical protein
MARDPGFKGNSRTQVGLALISLGSVMLFGKLSLRSVLQQAMGKMENGAA